MRLVRLHFPAFGPFTGLELDFDGARPGLHLVFGANEAGKSSALRGLAALLFGFPQQTPDNFLHSYEQLLVSGLLRHSSGEELFFSRRKRRIGDLLDTEGNPLDPQRLAPFLEGMDGSLFSSLYGIDHHTLVEGGEELLLQKGELGQALFAAGAGLSSVREVLRQFEEEAGALFLPTGQKPAINAALRQIKELQHQVREAALNVGDWKEQRRLLEEAESARRQAEEEREGVRRELRRLERLSRAAPDVAALRLWRQQLVALGEVPPLGDDFAERFQQAVDEQRDAEQRLRLERDRLARLTKRRRSVAVNQSLLRAAPLIDGFHRRLGEYLKGQKDRPERNGMRIALRGEAGGLLRLVRPDLPLDQVETLRPMLVKKRAMQTLAGNHAALRAALAAAEAERLRLQVERQALATALAALPEAIDTSALQRAVQAARAAGDIDARLAAGRGEYLRLRDECVVALSRQRLWGGELSALSSLPLPFLQTVHEFAHGFAEIEENRRLAEKDATAIDADERRVSGELLILDQAGAVPSEEELAASRKRRDGGWRLIKERLAGREDAPGEREYCRERDVITAYEEDAAQADTVADRLRREADRVALAASLRVRLGELGRAGSENKNRREDVEKQREDLLRQWRETWQPAAINPLSPREMVEWWGRIEQLRFHIGELAQKEEAGRRESERLGELRHLLETALCQAGLGFGEGEGLAPLLLLAEEGLEGFETLRKRRAGLVEMIEKIDRDELRAAEAVRRAGDELALWDEQWRSLVAGLGGGRELLPLEAVEVMEALQACFDKLRQAEELQKRIDGIDRDAAALSEEVRLVVHEVAPELLKQSPEQGIPALRHLLDGAVKEATLAGELDREIGHAAEVIAATGSQLALAMDRLAGLLAEARCQGREEVAEVVRRAALACELKGKVRGAEERLAALAPGMSEEQLAGELELAAVDELPGRIEQLIGQLEERLDPEINRLSQIIGQRQSLLAAMDGGARASELQEQVESELAKLRRLVRRYALVKVAERVLRRAIDRYREEHQSPVVSLASDYFRRLTLGSFDGLRVDSDDNGKPVLVGVRPGGQRLGVARMSSGSRDQLFLALRLATLVWRAQSGEPKPLILDDILINFDDPRSRATLELLAELAATTQIILFTHHRRIVEEAGTLDAGGGVTIHHLATS